MLRVVPCQKGAVLTTPAKMTSLHSTLARRGRKTRTGPLPKGPFRSKNAMAVGKPVVFYYCRSVLLFAYWFAAIFSLQARLKISSEPPTKPLFLWEFWRSRLKISSEIQIFKRDWKFQAKTWNFQAFKRDFFFSRFGPSGKGAVLMTPAKMTSLHSTLARRGRGTRTGPLAS